MLLCQSFCELDVRSLSPLVTAAKQDDQRSPLPGEVHPVAGTSVDAEFRYATADCFRIAKVASAHPFNPAGNGDACLQVAQSCEPFGEARRLLDQVVS